MSSSLRGVHRIRVIIITLGTLVCFFQVTDEPSPALQREERVNDLN